MLLSYGVWTAPAPLQASPPKGSTEGRVEVAVSNPAKAWCDTITLTVYAGDDARAFGIDAPSPSVNSADWTISDIDVDVDAQNPDQRARIIFHTKSGKPEQIDGHLAFCLVGDVNETVGQAQLVISERSGTDPNSLTWNTMPVTLDKVAPELYLQNLVALTPGSTVPVTEFRQKAPIHLQWESNGTWFEVYAKGDPTPVYNGPDPRCDVGPLLNDTTFFLVAQATGGPGSPNPGYQPVALYDSITLTVENPSLTPDSLGVAGAATVGGLLFADQFETTGTLLANGDAHIASAAIGTLDVSASTTLEGTTNVVGAIQIGAWTIQQDAGGQLVITNGTQTFALGSAGPLFNTHRMICDYDPIAIWNPGAHFRAGGGWLNGTDNSGGGGTGWVAQTYWMKDGDWASNLTVRYGKTWPT
jgi:hypothetical protein